MEEISESVVGTIATRTKVSARGTKFILFPQSRIEDLPTDVEDDENNKAC